MQEGEVADGRETGFASPALAMPTALPMEEPIDTVVSMPRNGSRHAKV